MKTRTGRNAVTALLCALVATACGGGGGGGDFGGGGGGGTTPLTYTASLTNVALTDSRTGESVDASGLPINGATITVD